MNTDPWTESDDKKLNALLRHIRLVQDGCHLLAEKLIEQGRAHLGRLLIAQSMSHDNSKFTGIEWQHMGADAHGDELKLAMRQHVETNAHHPEFWSGFENIPELFLAELVCDLYARSQEFGTDLREYVEESFAPRYQIDVKGRNYKRMKGFIENLLNKPFKRPVLKK